MKVLVVDDSQVIRTLVSSIITKMGHVVVLAENGKEGLLHIKQHEDVDLVLMDVEMPELNGFEATQAIRAFQKDNWFPVIFLTVKTDDESYEQCIKAGGDAFLSKPFSPTRLELQIIAMERIYVMRKKLQRAQQNDQT